MMVVMVVLVMVVVTVVITNRAGVAAPGDGTTGPMHAWTFTFMGPREPFHPHHIASSQGLAEAGRRRAELYRELRLQGGSGVRTGGYVLDTVGSCSCPCSWRPVQLRHPRLGGHPRSAWREEAPAVGAAQTLGPDEPEFESTNAAT